MGVIEDALKETLRDGILRGLQLAIDCLTTAQPHTALENQTWDSATAVLAMVRADYEKRRASPAPDTDRGEG